MKGPLQAAQVQALWQSGRTVCQGGPSSSWNKISKLAFKSHQNSIAHPCPTANTSYNTGAVQASQITLRWIKCGRYYILHTTEYTRFLWGYLLSLKEYHTSSRAWWHTPLIPALGRLRQADFWVRGQPGLQSEFQAIQRNPVSKPKKKKSIMGKWPIVSFVPSPRVSYLTLEHYLGNGKGYEVTHWRGVWPEPTKPWVWFLALPGKWVTSHNHSTAPHYWPSAKTKLPKPLTLSQA
jgi:hypothetical protein